MRETDTSSCEITALLGRFALTIARPRWTAADRHGNNVAMAAIATDWNSCLLRSAPRPAQAALAGLRPGVHPQWQGKATLRDAIVLAVWATDGAIAERFHGPPGFGLWHFLCLVPDVASIKSAADIAEAASVHHAAACRRCVSCIFGHLFHRVAIEPHWLAANGAAVARLADAIYAERAFDRMPILADALEEAGCANQDILTHCRSGEEHVRGRWALDLLTGRE